MQFEGSALGGHSITPSITLRELLAAQAAADRNAAPADAALAAIASGKWTPVKAPLATFAPLPHPSAEAAGVAGASFKADRLTIGACIQRLDGCSATMPPMDLCLDKLLLVL